MQVIYPKTGESRPTTWALYQLRPRNAQLPVTETAAAVDEKIDQLQFRLRLQRDEFDSTYPGAQKALDDIKNNEQQLRDLREKAKRLATRKPALPGTNLAARAEVKVGT